ncbi:MAG: decarboxylating 6-phosphogluconate dehydrogenase [Elusimicrobia bacterium]|nr:decarboxylating 6-phosphogluconate dehydrogenase [Elusimicrobiota bacterium]
MQLGMVGLGRMGANMARRLMRGGHSCVVYDLNSDSVKALAAEGAAAASSLEDLAAKLKPPRAAWVMLPAGGPTEKTVEALGRLFARGDAVVDGGNSFYQDDVRRAKALAPKGIAYLDAGTSGGLWGLERGYCLMVGGPKDAFARLEPVFKTLAPGRAAAPDTPGRKDGGTAAEGYLLCGPSGAGHFVKMVHNGIEYGIMQAYAEGFDVLRGAAQDVVPSERRYALELGEVAEVWRRGSVIGSWLLDLAAMAMSEDPALSKFTGFVHDSGEGRWTVNAAVEEAVSAQVLTASLFARFRSRQEHTFGEKVLSAMRSKFGGHAERPAGG